jgi:hypothetical protein
MLWLDELVEILATPLDMNITRHTKLVMAAPFLDKTTLAELLMTLESVR